MMHDQVNRDNCSYHSKRVCWTAVFIGALVGVGIAFLLNLFSTAISLSAFSPDKTGIASVAIGGVIGIAISTIIAMFIAGWVAGYLGKPHCAECNHGVLYGFVAWVLALLITVIFVTPFMHYVTLFTHFISSPSMVGNVRPGMDMLATNMPMPQVDIVNAQKATQGLGVTGIVVFVLFVLGALASCFGGHYGMCHRSDNKNHTH